MRCDKISYDSKKSAQSQINMRLRGRQHRRRGRPDYLRAYHCQHCNAWHLTHKPNDE